MAIRNDFSAGEVLAAADLNDTFESKIPYAYGTATPSTTVDGFVWYDENETPPAPKFWDGAAFQLVSPPSGLVHIATESFSAVSSVSLNGVFTSAYENYKIVMSHIGSTSINLSARLRASGTDASGATDYRNIYSDGSNATSTNTSSVTIMSRFSSVGKQALEGLIVAPFLAQQTAFIGQSGGDFGFRIYSASHLLTNSYDGFTLITDTGNMTGTIRVYGYANS